MEYKRTSFNSFENGSKLFFSSLFTVCFKRWLNRVMQDHEARASDQSKVNILVHFAIFLIKATET